jgi:hypothetical protein
MRYIKLFEAFDINTIKNLVTWIPYRDTQSFFDSRGRETVDFTINDLNRIKRKVSSLSGGPSEHILSTHIKSTNTFDKIHIKDLFGLDNGWLYQYPDDWFLVIEEESKRFFVPNQGHPDYYYFLIDGYEGINKYFEDLKDWNESGSKNQNMRYL